MKPKFEIETDDKPCIKMEETYPDYVEDYDRVKVEEILEPGIEADSAADSVDQIKVEFQESEKPEEQPPLSSRHFENTDALGLHHEFDIKTESVQSDRHDSASDSAQSKNQWTWEQVEEEKKLFSCYMCNYTDDCKKGLIVHIKRNNCHLGSVSRNQCRLNVCNTCNEVFKCKELLDNHIVREHTKSIASTSSKIYECTFCDHIFVRESHLTRHMLRHTDAKISDIHICKHCNTPFKTKRSLFGHILKNHPDGSKTDSMDCAYKTTRKSNFVRHMEKHNPFECINCNALFKTELSLDHHILQEHPELTASVTESTQVKHSRAKFTCTKCDVSYTNKRSLQNHIVLKHPGLTTSASYKIHRCTHCQYKSMYSRNLTMHMMKHTGNKLACIKCDASFKRKRSLDHHILQKHHEIAAASVSHKIYECTHCEYKTTFTNRLASHMNRHTGAKLACTTCDASFASKYSLDNHILLKHPEFTALVSHKIHECTHCQYKTTRSSDLAVHMTKHSGTKLTCTKCDVSYTSKQSLENHILQKHPELATSLSSKIHKCTHCQYKSIHARSLTMHMMKHTGAKLTCIKCDALFIRKLSLDHHILQKHPEIAASVSHKIHECTHCEYKTTHTHLLASHMTKHTGAKFRSNLQPNNR